MTLQLGDSALTHFPLAEKCLPTKEYLGMQHACTNKCLPLQEHLDVCVCPWHFHKSKVLNRGIYEFTNAENHVSNFWTLYHQSMFKLSRVFSPGLTAPTPWSVPRCPNPWNTSASFWRPGCWKLEFYYLKGQLWRDITEILQMFCGTVYINLQCLSFWQFIPQIWSLLGTLSTPINSASWPGGLAHLLQADTAWYNTGCLTFS